MREVFNKMRDANSPVIVLIETELREFFLSPRCLHFLPLLLFGVFLMSWTFHVMPPFGAIIVVVFCALEPQINNIFFRSASELEALNLFPVNWREVILAKNIAAILLVLSGLVASSAVLCFFSPRVVGPSDVLEGVFYFTTVIFPVIQIGNANSIHNARRRCGWQFSDFLEMLWMAVTLLVVSIPYVLINYYLNYALVYFAFGAIGAYFWYTASLPKQAKLLSDEFTNLCNIS